MMIRGERNWNIEYQALRLCLQAKGGGYYHMIVKALQSFIPMTIPLLLKALMRPKS